MTAELHDEVLLLTTFAAQPTSALVNSAAAAGKRSHPFVDAPTTDEGDAPSESGALPGSDPHMEDEKRLKRMRRNRESAALSRSRKKAYVEELESKVEELQRALQVLQAENARLLHERARQPVPTTVQPPAAPTDVGPAPTAPAQDAPQRPQLCVQQNIGEESDSRNPRPALRSPLADSAPQNAARTPRARNLQPPPRSPSRTSCCEALLQFSTSSAPQPQQPQPQPYCSSVATNNNHDTCTAMKVC